MRDNATSPRGGITLDFSVNIPTLILICTTFVSITAGWVHLTDTQKTLADKLETQEYTNKAIAAHIDRWDRTSTVLNQKLRTFPLHRHVGNTIIYDAPAAQEDFEYQGEATNEGDR